MVSALEQLTQGKWFNVKIEKLIDMTYLKNVTCFDFKMNH